MPRENTVKVALLNDSSSAASSAAVLPIGTDGISVISDSRASGIHTSSARLGKSGPSPVERLLSVEPCPLPWRIKEFGDPALSIYNGLRRFKPLVSLLQGIENSSGITSDKNIIEGWSKVDLGIFRPRTGDWGEWQLRRRRADAAGREFRPSPSSEEFPYAVRAALFLLSSNKNVLFFCSPGHRKWENPTARSLFAHPAMTFRVVHSCAFTEQSERDGRCSRLMVGGSSLAVRRLWRRCVCGGAASTSAGIRDPPRLPARFVARWAQSYLFVDCVNKCCIDIPSRDSGLGVGSKANSLGEGPSQSKLPMYFMDDLPCRRPISAEELSRRKVALKDFDGWLAGLINRDHSILPALPSLAGILLGDYGRSLYRKRKRLENLVAAILGVTDKFRFMRGHLTPAWDLVRIWGDFHPSELTVPCPLILLRAMVALALIWGWTCYARYLSHTFFSMARGCEMGALKRRDAVSRSDLLRPFPCLYAKVLAPKNSWAGPRVQHTTLEEPSVLPFVEAGLRDLDRDDHVCPFSQAQTTYRWQNILSVIEEVPGELKRQPRSLRGGGTVELLETTRSLPYVKWRGRWMTEKNLAFYLQEA